MDDLGRDRSTQVEYALAEARGAVDNVNARSAADAAGDCVAPLRKTPDPSGQSLLEGEEKPERPLNVGNPTLVFPTNA